MKRILTLMAAIACLCSCEAIIEMQAGNAFSKISIAQN